MENNGHILVIDDNADILIMLETMLKTKGYKVSIKEDSNDITSFLKESAPDIILMDMLLTGSDGRMVCKQLKNNTAYSHIPVVMLSAHPQAEEDCMEAGADYFLNKPFEMTDLFKTVTFALSQNS